MTGERFQIKEWSMYPGRYLVIDTERKREFVDKYTNSAFDKWLAIYIAFKLNTGCYLNNGRDFMSEEIAQ